MPKKYITFFSSCLLFPTLFATTAFAQGISLTGVGPINRSMGGASTALPLDSAGAILWNPATISGLQSSETMIGAELLWPETKVSSSIDALNFSGSTRGDNGPVAIPNAAIVKKSENSPITFGFGLLSIAGFRVDYPGDPKNPVLTPQPPTGGGLGRTYGNAEIYQLVPTLSYAVNENLSIGFAPTLTIAKLEATPLVFADPNRNGSYPSGTGSQSHYGGGFQIGAFYKGDSGLNFGASIKSPQWIEDFQFDTEDENGLPRRAKVDFDYPMIPSLGFGYTGIENLSLALDIRYFDYANANGFDKSGFGSTGAVQGLGWKSIFAVATGAQYQVTDSFSLRAGYYFNENPISGSDTLFNVATPLIVQHILSVGASYEIIDDVILSAGLLYGFENDVNGNLKGATGDIPGTSVRSEVYAYAANMGVTVKY